MVLSLLVTVSIQEVIHESLITKLHTYNLMVQCYGEDFVTAWHKKLHKATKKCGGSEPADDAEHTEEGSRTKRTAIDSSTALSNLIGEWNSKMGNLTCVLKELEYLNQEGEINTERFTIEDVTKTFKDTNAGADPVFLQKMSTKMNDCYAISESWPQSTLNENDFKKKYGRHMVFFTCCMKEKRELCIKYQFATLMEKWDAQVPSNAYSTDKYDAAAWNKAAIRHEYTPEEKCIEEFFWGEPKM